MALWDKLCLLLVMLLHGQGFIRHRIRDHETAPVQIQFQKMHTLLILSAAAFISSSFAAFDPFTVTGLTPQQSSAVDQAASSLLASIQAEPAFTSIILEIATNTKAFNALTQLVGQPSNWHSG